LDINYQCSSDVANEFLRVEPSNVCVAAHEHFPIFLFHFWSHFCFISQQMPIANPLQVPGTGPTAQPNEPKPVAGQQASAEKALVPAPFQQEVDEGSIALSGPVARLPVELDVSVASLGCVTCWLLSRAR
jgi:hypothetical protein